MPRKCAAYKCRGNYNGEPYSQMVKFPSQIKEEEWKEWITDMPNPLESLLQQKEIYICQKHFHPDCKWKKICGGKCPDEPPSIFENVPSSCLKRRKTRRSTTSTSEVRYKKQNDRELELDKIKSFTDFVDNVQSRINEKFYLIKNENGNSLFMTDDIGSKVVLFLNFKSIISPFGFLQLHRAEKDGMHVPKTLLTYKKTMFCILVMISHEASTQDHVNKVIKECKQINELTEVPSFQFFQEQLQLMTTSPNGRRYSKHVLIFTAELICVSPAAYRLLRNSETIILPREKLVCDLMNKSFQNDNLENLFTELKPQQRLVNILFDEVKLKKSNVIHKFSYYWASIK